MSTIQGITGNERDVFKDFRLMQHILLQNEQNLDVFRRVRNEIGSPSCEYDNFDLTLGLFINNQKIL